MSSFPSPVQSKTVEDRALTAPELKAWMDKQGFGEKELGEFLGVTWQAVRLWIRGERNVPMTTSKIIRLMQKYPQLMREF